jgi:hypothetical protein
VLGIRWSGALLTEARRQLADFDDPADRRIRHSHQEC